MLNEELFEEDTDKFYEETLLSDIDDCMYCMFDEDREYCSPHPDGHHPCEYKDSTYEGMTMVEVKESLDAQRSRYEDYMERQYLKEKELKKKKEKAAEKRRQTQWENRDLNSEMQRLKKSINAKRACINSMRSLSRAFAFANNMMYKTPMPEEEIEKHPYEIDIEKMEQRIEEIKLEKKDRAKERRLRNKTEDK